MGGVPPLGGWPGGAWTPAHHPVGPATPRIGSAPQDLVPARPASLGPSCVAQHHGIATCVDLIVILSTDGSHALARRHGCRRIWCRRNSLM